MPIRILIASDLRLYREGLALALGNREGLDLVGALSHEDDVLGQVQALAPELLLLDMGFPGAIGVLRSVREHAREMRVLAIAITEIAQEVVACAEAGAAGYVPRDASLEDLMVAIQRTMRGELVCSPAITATLFQRLRRQEALSGPPVEPSPLSVRELEIVRLIDRGLSNKQIARQLFIEVATVKSHIHNILEKLHVSRRGEAAARLRERAYSHGR